MELIDLNNAYRRELAAEVGISMHTMLALTYGNRRPSAKLALALVTACPELNLRKLLEGPARAKPRLRGRLLKKANK